MAARGRVIAFFFFIIELILELVLRDQDRMLLSGGWFRKATLLLRNYVLSLLPSRSEENESAEIYFCENHQLNLSTLRMTAEAKVGLHLPTVQLYQA